MGYKKRFSVIVIISICLAISAFFGIAYAAFTQNLSISNGSATIPYNKWEIKLQNLSAPLLEGSAELISSPSISANGQILNGFSFTFWEPGDSITYTLNVTNSGTFDAYLQRIMIGEKTCTVVNTGSSNSVSSSLCNDIDVSLTYSDGTALSLNDSLAAGESKTLKLKITYSSNATEPQSDIKVVISNSYLVYAQA